VTGMSLFVKTELRREDAFHYLFTCPNYTEIRLIMMNNLNWEFVLVTLTFDLENQ
jgi:hypothetical protein